MVKFNGDILTEAPNKAVSDLSDNALTWKLALRLEQGGTVENSPIDEILDADPDFDFLGALKQGRVQQLILSIPGFPQDYFKMMFKRKDRRRDENGEEYEEYDERGDIFDGAIEENPKKAAQILMRWPRFRAAVKKWAVTPQCSLDDLGLVDACRPTKTESVDNKSPIRVNVHDIYRRWVNDDMGDYAHDEIAKDILTKLEEAGVPQTASVVSLLKRFIVWFNDPNHEDEFEDFGDAMQVFYDGVRDEAEADGIKIVGQVWQK